MDVSTVSVIGLGKLGACMAVCLADKGLRVIGVDSNPNTVAKVNEGQSPVYEPGLEEMYDRNKGRLVATEDTRGAVLNSQVTFVVVPTPSSTKGGFSLKYVKKAVSNIGEALRDKKDYHTIAVTSTVMPGSTEGILVPLLRSAVGRKIGDGYGICYNPEFIALGSVVRDFLHPEFVLIGELQERDGAILEDIYEAVCENSPPVARMIPINAELAKISLNSYVTTKITFANTLAQMCEALPGADVDIVTSALGLDSRIGPRSLKGSIGYGGPCFPRDNVAFTHLATTLGCDARLAQATDSFNRSIPEIVAGKIDSSLLPGATVSVLGIAYKPNTNVIEESQGLEIARILATKGHYVIVYDPAPIPHTFRNSPGHLRHAKSLRESLSVSDAIVITNPLQELTALGCLEPMGLQRPLKVFDCWRAMRDTVCRCGCTEYVPLGIGSENPVRSNGLKWLSDE